MPHDPRMRRRRSWGGGEHIYIYAQTLSLFTPQTLHPDILRKQKPQTWHHVFLPTYGPAEADDAQRLKL